MTTEEKILILRNHIVIMEALAQTNGVSLEMMRTLKDQIRETQKQIKVLLT